MEEFKEFDGENLKIEEELTYEEIVELYGEAPEYKFEEEFKAESILVAPTGLAAIIKMFGQPMVNGKLSQSWYNSSVCTVNLPFPMRNAYNTKSIVKTAAIHKLLAKIFISTLTEIYNYARSSVKKISPGLTTAQYDKLTLEYLQKDELDLYGGTFCFRKKRNGSGLSLHSFSICLDINPSANAQSTPGCMPEWYLKIWEKNGWTCGARWKGKSKDPMHLQFAKGY